MRLRCLWRPRGKTSGGRLLPATSMIARPRWKPNNPESQGLWPMSVKDLSAMATPQTFFSGARLFEGIQSYNDLVASQPPFGIKKKKVVTSLGCVKMLTGVVVSPCACARDTKFQQQRCLTSTKNGSRKSGESHVKIRRLSVPSGNT